MKKFMMTLAVLSAMLGCGSAYADKCSIDMTRQEAADDFTKYSRTGRVLESDMFCCHVQSRDCPSGYAWVTETMCKLDGEKPVSNDHCK